MNKNESITQRIVDNISHAIESLPKVLSFEDAKRKRVKPRRSGRAHHRASTVSAAKKKAGAALGRAKKAKTKAKRSVSARVSHISRKVKARKAGGKPSTNAA